MATATPSMSARQEGFLAEFKRDLTIPMTDRADLSLWLANVKKILTKTVQQDTEDPIIGRAYDLQERFKWPLLDKRSNRYALQILHKEMRCALEEQVNHLSSFLRFQEMLSVITPYQIESFLRTVHENCHKNILEGLSSEKAFCRSLSYALGRSLIETNDLQDEEVLQRYICPIRGDVIESQPVHLREDSQNQARELYHEGDLLYYLVDSHRDPITRERRTDQDVRKDPREKEKAHDAILALKFPLLNGSEIEPSSPTVLPTPAVFFAACIGYPLAKETYARVQKESGDYNDASTKAAEIESVAIDLFKSFLVEADEEDFRFLKWKPKEEKEFTNAQRWDSYSWSVNSPKGSHSSRNVWETKIQFMQEFLRYQISKSTVLDSVEILQTKLASQMQEYMDSCQEIDASDICESEKKDLRARALKLILSEEDSSSLRSTKRRSLESSSSVSFKRNKLNSSSENVQMRMLHQFFV